MFVTLLQLNRCTNFDETWDGHTLIHGQEYTQFVTAITDIQASGTAGKASTLRI